MTTRIRAGSGGKQRRGRWADEDAGSRAKRRLEQDRVREEEADCAKRGPATTQHGEQHACPPAMTVGA